MDASKAVPSNPAHSKITSLPQKKSTWFSWQRRKKPLPWMIVSRDQGQVIIWVIQNERVLVILVCITDVTHFALVIGFYPERNSQSIKVLIQCASVNIVFFLSGKKNAFGDCSGSSFSQAASEKETEISCLNNDWTIPQSINNSNESAWNLVQWVSHVSQPVNKEQPSTILRS